MRGTLTVRFQFQIRDPMLPVPSQSSGNSAAILAQITQPIAATAPMENWEEPQLYSNSNHIILKASLIKHFSYGFTNGQTHWWPKQFSIFQKKAMLELNLVLELVLELVLQFNPLT